LPMKPPAYVAAKAGYSPEPIQIAINLGVPRLG